MARDDACRCMDFGPCLNSITQEDLLCDHCREGCRFAIGPTPGRSSDGLYHLVSLDPPALRAAHLERFGFDVGTWTA